MALSNPAAILYAGFIIGGAILTTAGAHKTPDREISVLEVAGPPIASIIHNDSGRIYFCSPAGPTRQNTCRNMATGEKLSYAEALKP